MNPSWSWEEEGEAFLDWVGVGEEGGRDRQVARGFALEGTVWMGVTAMLNLLYCFFASFLLVLILFFPLCFFMCFV